MHREARDWIGAAAHVFGPFDSILDLGADEACRGVVRDLFFGVQTYDGVDVQLGSGVNILADPATFRSTRTYDCVVTCEFLQHSEQWPMVLDTAIAHLPPTGVVIGTAAALGRRPHKRLSSTIDYCQPIKDLDLGTELDIRFRFWRAVNRADRDLFFVAVK